RSRDSARVASSSRSAGSRSTWRAARFDSSWAGVTAPDRTTLTQGLARTAARATASTPTPCLAATRARASADGPWPWGVRRPLATASLMITPPPAAPGSAEGGAAGGQADDHALVAEAGQLVEDGAVLQDAAVEGGRVDLVEVEVVAEQR